MYYHASLNNMNKELCCWASLLWMSFVSEIYIGGSTTHFIIIFKSIFVPDNIQEHV